jgi:NADP-dependent 3-hydroxy acid dehydrogenase YdfG
MTLFGGSATSTPEQFERIALNSGPITVNDPAGLSFYVVRRQELTLDDSLRPIGSLAKPAPVDGSLREPSSEQAGSTRPVRSVRRVRISLTGPLQVCRLRSHHQREKEVGMDASLFSNDASVANLAGKTVIVTGGTTGIGRATARLLASTGARLLICGRHEKEMSEALADMPSGVRGMLTDLSTLDGVKELFRRADREFDGLDILINNAALPVRGTAEVDPKDIEYVIRSNLLNYVQCTRQALERMMARKAGHIVFIGSMSADVRAEGESTYAATKGGIQAFAGSLRKEVNQAGIRISLIQPGSVGTDMQKDKATHADQAQQLTMLKAEDIASCVQYCLIQPPRCDVVAMDVRPHLQAI